MTPSLTLEPMQCAREYLAPGTGAFWRWSQDRSAVELPSGQTIGLGAEVLALVGALERLGRGLPPIDAIVGILALARDAWPTPAERGDHSLPQRIRRSHGSMLALIELACRALPHRDAAFAAAVARAIDHGLPGEMLSDRKEAAPAPAVVLKWLRDGLADLDEGRVARLAATGIDDEVDRAELELPPHERAMRLLDALAADRPYAGLAALARQVLAALVVPRPRPTLADRPMGGVAGITNRGGLDRLTLGELANDAEVLALRIALGEAMYSEREVPPLAPEVHRLVLCDTGIRMWGRPRVFAAAVAIALGAHGDPRRPTTTLAAEPAAVAPIDLTRRRGVHELLQRLRLPADPRGALPGLFAACAGLGGRSEVFVVTHREAARDPAFRAALRPPAGVAAHVATVDGDGHFALWAVRDHDWQCLGEASLDLGGIAPRLAQRDLRDVHRPAYYGVAPMQPNKVGMLRKIAAIGGADNGIHLRMQKGTAFAIHWSRGQVWLARMERTAGTRTPMRPFAETIPARGGPEKVPRMLRARFGEGQALSDGNGLLHLIPDNADAPQVTVALSADRPLIGWVSTAGYAGNPRLAPPGLPVLPPQALWGHLLECTLWMR